MKYGINVVEKVKLNHTITFEIDACLEEVDTLLNKAQSGAMGLDDVASALSRLGCKDIEVIEDGSGDVEIEIDDLYKAE